MTLPKLTLKWRSPGCVTLADHDYFVTLHRVPGKSCGYPQRRIMWHMQFSEGGCHASAFLETQAGAWANAARIVGHARGTHDVFGNVQEHKS